MSIARRIEERSRLLNELKKPSGCTPLGVWTNDGGAAS